jgi:DNA-binding CsgD family transcriptional regulator
MGSERAEAPDDHAGDLARAEVLLSQARQQSRDGRFSDGWHASVEAAAIARRLGDGRLMARAATALKGPTLNGYALTSSRRALCIEALSLLGPHDAELTELVSAQLGALSSPWSASTGPVERLDPEEAERRFVNLQAEHAAAVGPDGVDARLTLGGEIVELGSAAFDDEISAWGRLWRLDALLQLGRRVEFDTELIEFAAVISRHPAPVWHWRLAGVKASLALLEDRLADVPELIADMTRRGEEAGVEGVEWMTLIIRSSYAQRTGEGLDEIEAEVRQALSGAPFFAQGWRAGLLIGLGRPDDANAIWRGIAPHLGEMPKATPEWLLAMCGYAQNAIVADDTPAAAWLRDALEPYADQHITVASTTPYGGPVSLPLAELCVFLGDRASASHWFDDAARQSESMNAPWYAARARDKKDQLVRRRGPLSPRELEVARMVATGESNRSIAARMHLSERTVEQHVSTSLRKLGMSSRSALAAWVVASSLPRPD